MVHFLSLPVIGSTASPRISRVVTPINTLSIMFEISTGTMSDDFSISIHILDLGNSIFPVPVSTSVRPVIWRFNFLASFSGITVRVAPVSTMASTSMVLFFAGRRFLL